MNFNDENDEALNLAIKASLEQEQDLENPARKAAFKKSRAQNNSDSDDEEETLDDEETLDEESVSNVNAINNNTTDDDITLAIESSLFDYNKNEEQMLSLAMTASLNTIEDDRKRKLKHQIEEDEILSKVIEESYTSNITAQFNSGLVISDGASNNYGEYKDAFKDQYEDEDEEEYIREILQQIKDNEEQEAKLKQTKKTRSIIEDQDLEFEEALKQDIAKEKNKKKNDFENIIDSVEITNDNDNDTDTDNIELDKFNDIPKTADEMRKARLAFFEKSNL